MFGKISLFAVEENAAGKKPLSCCVVFKFTDSIRPPRSKSNKSNFNFSRANKAKLFVFVGVKWPSSAPVAPWFLFIKWKPNNPSSFWLNRDLWFSDVFISYISLKNVILWLLPSPVLSAWLYSETVPSKLNFSKIK